MEERYLIKPPLKYIYDILMSTFAKTGYPAGLFTDEEMDLAYFQAVSIKSNYFRTLRTD
jgi:hypothetical protein